MNRNNLIKIMIAAVLILLVIQIPVFSFSFGKSHGGNYSIPEGMDFSGMKLTDGTYTGTADGFRPELTVEITVEAGELVNVEIIDHNEVGRQYFLTPINMIPDEIVDQQKSEVDSVSGATATSKAIMAAVENAVKKALGE